MNINETWFDVTSQDDIDTLLNEYYGFHDSCIVSVQYTSGAAVDDAGFMGSRGNNYLIIRFDSQMPTFFNQSKKKTLELKFSVLRRINLIGIQDNYFCDISDCYLAFYQNHIIWANTECFNPLEYFGDKLLDEYMNTFVIADHLSWRFVK